MAWGIEKERLFGRNPKVEIFSVDYIFISVQFEHVFLKTALTFLRGVNSWKKLKIETKANNSKIMFATYVIMSQVICINQMFLMVFFYKYANRGTTQLKCIKDERSDPR